ncbi:isoprenylcysteine carboxylmethyltransferase family protein [Pseudomonas batumici]|uniref:methyltransferase family protein n=1 Tax=Pseudomonas batumici TaxID=226910 RepID=UPI0030CF965E
MKVSLRLAFFSIAATLAYLGLAVWAFGGWTAFMSRPPLLVIAVVTLLLAGSALFTEGNLSSGVREDRGNRWVILAIGGLGLLLVVLAPWTDHLGWWVFGGEGVRWVGVLLFTVGGVLRMWPVFVLGKRFSGLVAIQPGHRLVTTGIYRTLRNPSYLGLLVNSLGWALAFRSGVGVLLTALTLIPLIARMRSEEALLKAEFGEEYEAYRSRTWRLLPWVY